MHPDDSPNDSVDALLRAPSFGQLLEELESGLVAYWTTAEQILKPCGVNLLRPGEDTFSLPRNFFSLLFLYSYRRLGIPPGRRRLYAATLQCLRGMVTGCDNLLDDEYKPTLESDIPAHGYRFRSVVDIMVSDGALFQILMEAAQQGELAYDRVLAAATASMQTMTRSGIEEVAEEAGIDAILPPQAILQTIHHYKTGIPFQCPWDIPRAIEPVVETDLAPVSKGLNQIGIGCQILDDMVDLEVDIRSRRHNYLVSLIHHAPDPDERSRLAGAMHPGDPDRPEAPTIDRFPLSAQQAWKTAHQLLTQGLAALFAPEDRTLVVPAIRLMEKRIGAAAPWSGAGR